MSVKVRDNENLLENVNDLLIFDTEDERIEFKAIAIQLDILAEVNNLMKQNSITRKELADKLGKSKSFVSQLFSGDKMLNLKMLAKLQEILGAKFQSSFREYSSFNKRSTFSKSDYKNDDYNQLTNLIFDMKTGKRLDLLKAA